MPATPLTDTAIRTELLYRRDDAAESARIGTRDDGLVAPRPSAFELDSESDQVRALLFPHSLSSFIADYYEKKWLFIERGETPRPHEDLYPIAALLADFREQRLPTNVVQFVGRNVADERIDLAADDVTLESVNTSNLEQRLSLLNFERVAEYIENGAGSIVVNRIECFVPRIFDLVWELGADLRTDVLVNAYYTPRGSRTFDIHWDYHDVFVLQVDGRKHWRAYETLVPLPLSGRDYMESEAFEGYAEALKYDTITLGPGDALYLPRGVPHCAWTDDSSALHLTVGLLQPTWMDVLQAAADEVLRSCEKNLSFRTNCPAVFAGIPDRDLRRTFEGMVEVFRRKLLDTDPRLLVRRMVSKTPRIFRGQRGAAVCTNTVVARNPSIHFRGHGTDGSWLEFHERVLRFPPGTVQAVEFVASARRFVVREIPGLSDEERIVLTNRLLGEGFLRLLEQGLP
jgi:ribosomal protein L16 Arg81 hydroxylase